MLASVQFLVHFVASRTKNLILLKLSTRKLSSFMGIHRHGIDTVVVSFMF